uniref:Uncharacterized protein n=1 Tax=Anguilla anguilla TaxID=7936 RepID=A0A0E9UYJ7_ANGAN
MRLPTEHKYCIVCLK